MTLKKPSKKRLVEYLKNEGYLVDRRLEEAIQVVDERRFIPKKYLEYFYRDKAVPFYKKHPIPTPSMITILIQTLELEEGEDVLLLGADSGYLAALISEICHEHVYLVDSHKEVCDFATEKLIDSGYEKSVTVINRDPLKGIPEKEEWSKILLLGQIPNIPTQLERQLSHNGILLAPVGPEVTDKTDEEVDQEFTRIQRKKNEFIKTPLGGVLFVPLASKDTRNIQADKNFKPPKTTIEEEFKNNTDFIKKLHKLVEENEEISRFRERIATVRRCPLNLAPCGKLREIKKSYSEKNIFVDIPYKEEYLHFEQAISETLEENGLNPVFAKDETKSHELLCKVCRSIQSCNYGIADISYQSSNVLYELGMMHALGMDVAILKDKNAKKPSDISGKEDIRYANTEQLKAQLGKWIKDSIMTK